MAEGSRTAFQVRIPTELRSRIAAVAKKAGKTSTELVLAAVTNVVESADEERLESRFEALGKATSRIARRIEDLMAVVKSIEDDEVERRRSERKVFTEAMGDHYRAVAEAIAENSAAIGALVDEVRSNREAMEKVNNRLDGQALMIVAIIHGTPDKAIRKAYLDIYTAVTKDGKKLTDFQRDAMTRGV